ncbi:hypothetical protein BKD30_07290 [Tersicoccus phoenicis]|uniref:Alkaline phosphatase n=1 Tax=Tersicoccus phoenicis TaxID=554083 RepID=A0A1R1LBE4_9MICC|nr:alkaline phosphatase [Tersicoccus phoenicis]OMH24849.1 hypothetical protein BKD30_07290 [Tersicoccus phoenicis]
MRRAVRVAAVAAVAVPMVLSGTSALGSAAGPGDERARAKNVILLIADGMGTTHVDAARQRLAGSNGKLNMERMPNYGSVSTYSVDKNSNKPVTVPDSAATATAWSSGVKTYNGAIGKDAYGKDLVTIMEQAKQAGLRTGNVSTAEITDATPAAPMAHAANRQCQGPTTSGCQPGEANIAHQVARNGTADVIFGGGMRRFEPDDQAAFQKQGYAVLGNFGDRSLPVDQGAQTASTQRVPDRTDLQSIPAGTKKVVGLFNRGNLTVEKSKALAPASVEAKEPTLPDMTSKAIQLLSAPEYGKGEGRGDKRGFFLQVESALVDKRSHANDAGQTLTEMEYFDRAVKTAQDFANSPAGRGTLVIVSADHECAGFNIIGKDSFTNAEAANPPGNVDSSNTANNSTPRRESGANTLDPRRSTGIINGTGAGAKNPGNFAPATFRTADDPKNVSDGDPEASLWMTYVSGNHTGANVPIFSQGPGSELLDGRIDQTAIYDVMAGALKGTKQR